MARGLGPGRVVEFGPGTGRLTEGLLQAGVRQEDLTLLEMNPDFVAHVKKAASIDRPIVIICRSGNRSQVAVAAMSEAGINGIYELESGIVGWDEAGFPTVS